MCHLTGECRHLSNIIFSFPLYIFPEAGLLNHTVVLFSIFWGNFMLFSLLVTIFYIPKTVHKCPLCSPSSPVPLIPCLLVMTILTGVRCCLRVVWICISPDNQILSLFPSICWNGVQSLSHVWLFAVPWTIAPQAGLPWTFPGKNQTVCIIRVSYAESANHYSFSDYT